MDSPMATVNTLHADHTRLFHLDGRIYRSVYPVLSRRAGGLSVGINLNLDKGCNFDCIYCQVDRTVPPLPLPGDLRSDTNLIMEELRHFFDAFDSGDFFRTSSFGQLPSELRKIKDIAFSGDGEPTLASSFREGAQAVRAFVEGHDWQGEEPPLLRLITNGSGLFPREARLFVRTVFFERGSGEIWLKLDAADRLNYERIDRSPIPFSRLMDGLDKVAADLPVTIQTMVLDYGEEGDPEGFRADRTLWEPLLDKVVGWSRMGAEIKAWHLYSVARPPAVSAVRPVPETRLRAWAEEASRLLPFPVQVFP